MKDEIMALKINVEFDIIIGKVTFRRFRDGEYYWTYEFNDWLPNGRDYR